MTVNPHHKYPKTVEATLESCLVVLALEADDTYDPSLHGVVPTHRFTADLCARVLQLERMLMEVPYGVVATVRDELAKRDGP